MKNILNGNGKKKTKVTIHDSCHMGRVSGVYEEPRDLIKAVPGVELVEMEDNRENGLCCGSVLSRVGRPPAARIPQWRQLEDPTQTLACNRHRPAAFPVRLCR